jgi:hypothetical protein
VAEYRSPRRPRELTIRAASLDEVELARADRLIAERLGTIPPQPM